MKALTIHALALFLLLSGSGDAYAQSYFSVGKKIPLKIDSTKIRIRFDREIDSNARVPHVFRRGFSLWGSWR